jgi:hypothetical protein
MRGEPGRARVVHRGPTAARTEGAGARWRNRERRTGSSAQASPELGRWRGDRATRRREEVMRNLVRRGSDVEEEKRGAQ